MYREKSLCNISDTPFVPTFFIFACTVCLSILTIANHDLRDPRSPNAPRKRRSRWSKANAELPGLLTAISASGVFQSQLDSYTIHLRLEETNHKPRLNDFIPPECER